MELLWSEDGPAWKVHGVYVRAEDGLNTWIDVSDTLETKLKALREHHSQLDENTGLEDMIRQRHADAGKDHDLACAEAFRVIKLKE
jgi:LmbE family N-acetylglucosaminyl deacetylase